VESYTIPATDKEILYSTAEESRHLVGLTTWPPTSEIYMSSFLMNNNL